MNPTLAATTLGNRCVGKPIRPQMRAAGGGQRAFVPDRDNFATATTRFNAFWAAFSGNSALFGPFTETGTRIGLSPAPKRNTPRLPRERVLKKCCQSSEKAFPMGVRVLDRSRAAPQTYGKQAVALSGTLKFAITAMMGMVTAAAT
jgi:hypothetical protein